MFVLPNAEKTDKTFGTRFFEIVHRYTEYISYNTYISHINIDILWVCFPLFLKKIDRYLCLARNLRNPKKDIAVGVRIYAFF